MFKRFRAWFGATALDSEGAGSSRPKGVRIDFGNNEWSGANISFGNVTGGSLIQRFGPAPTQELFPNAGEDLLRDLEAVYLKHNARLREQIERSGDHVAPDVLEQFIDSERYLAEIKRKLDQAPPRPNSHTR